MNHNEIEQSHCWRCAKMCNQPIWVDVMTIVATVSIYMGMLIYITNRVFDRVDRAIYHLHRGF